MRRSWITAALAGVATVACASSGVTQPLPNALVPGEIAPYAPQRSSSSPSAPTPRAAISTPNGPVAPGTPNAQGAISVASASEPTSAAPSAVASYDYVLGAGDKLRVIVFDEEKLSGEFVVAGNGTLSLPLIGDVPATGKTVRQVLADITRKLAVYLKDPRVSAEVETFRPYFILGEVAKPGEYPYSDGITVMNAIATAGGFTYRADHRFVFVRHANKLDETRVRLSDSLVLAPGDTVRIRERYF